MMCLLHHHISLKLRKFSFDPSSILSQKGNKIHFTKNNFDIAISRETRKIQTHLKDKMLY